MQAKPRPEVKRAGFDHSSENRNDRRFGLTERSDYVFSESWYTGWDRNAREGAALDTVSAKPLAYLRETNTADIISHHNRKRWFNKELFRERQSSIV